MSVIRKPLKFFTTLGLGAAVRAERRAFGLTQAGLAAAAGVRRQRISEIERGENVTVLLLLRVLGALGMGLQIVTIKPNPEDWRALFEDG